MNLEKLEKIEKVIRKETNFCSLNDMCNKCKGSYTPTLRADLNPDLIQVAEAFNNEMKNRGINKTAFLVLKK